MGPEVVVSISAIEHYAYCPRQCALIHVEGQWADNRSTVEGTRAHRRADSEVARQERGRLVLRSLPLWSEALGLSGRADVVEVNADGSVTPVEYKSGVRHGDAADLQVCAQGMCLEEMFAINVPQAYVWYGGPRRRSIIELTPRLRDRTVAVVDEIRRALISGILPPAPADERCPSCQLRGACLPDLVSDGDSALRYLEREVWS